MYISELVKKLNKIKRECGDIEVTILDGFNGCGQPRTINMGPFEEFASEHEETEDIETQGDTNIVIMGCGSY